MGQRSQSYNAQGKAENKNCAHTFLGVDMLLGDEFDARVEEQRQLEQHLAEQDAVKIGVNTSFDQLCRSKLQTQVPFELQHTYRQWLLSLSNSYATAVVPLY